MLCFASMSMTCRVQRAGLVKTLLLLLQFSLVGVVSGSAADLLPFRAGISTVSDAFVIQLWMAEDAGLFKKHGLTVELIDMEGGTRGLQVLLSGQIQAMHVGLGPMIRANSQGADMRLIASFCNTIPFTIFTPANVKTASDLKGGTVGISSFGSESDIAMDIALKRLGLTRRDVTVTQIGGGSVRLAALLSGRVKAVPLSDPISTKALELGLNPIVDLAAAKVPWVFEGVVVNRAYLESHRDLFARFLRATIEGTHLAYADERRARDLIARKFKTNDNKVVSAGYNTFKQLAPLDPQPLAAGVENVLEQLQAIGAPIANKKVEDQIDTSIVEMLRKGGFFADLRQQYKIK
jgi:ABC-type nitrate/sulfonate/bicarbonate transport system substrate-binding protein